MPLMTVELKDFTSFSNFIRDINSEKFNEERARRSVLQTSKTLF